MQTRTLGACNGPERAEVSTAENSSDDTTCACGREATGFDARRGEATCRQCARARADGGTEWGAADGASDRSPDRHPMTDGVDLDDWRELLDAPTGYRVVAVDGAKDSIGIDDHEATRVRLHRDDTGPRPWERAMQAWACPDCGLVATTIDEFADEPCVRADGDASAAEARCGITLTRRDD